MQVGRIGVASLTHEIQELAGSYLLVQIDGSDRAFEVRHYGSDRGF